MQSHDSTETSSDPAVLAARAEVELAKSELQNRLTEAGETGRRALARMARTARPVLVLTAVVAGIVGVFVLARMLRKGRSSTAAAR